MKRHCFLLLIFFTNFSLEQRMTTYKRVKKKRERPGTRYELAPHLDYDDAMYNPVAAFEPYWPVGEWVYEESYTTFYTTTSTLPPMAIGRPCPKHYRHIGDICTHMMSRSYKVQGCETQWDCQGDNMDLLYGYKTFPNFCIFLEFHHRYGMYYKFIFVHVGKCIREQPFYHPYNPIFRPGFIPLRFDYFMDKLNHTFFNLTTEEDRTIGPPTDMALLLGEDDED